MNARGLDSDKSLSVKPTEVRDRAWIRPLLETSWRATTVVTRGRAYAADTLPGFGAWLDDQPVGLVTYRIEQAECEIITLNSLVEDRGVATALVEAVKQQAVKAHCRRLWLITTNDNLRALAFYQKRGFHLCALYPNAIEESRRIKPQISEIGANGIAIRDELELEMALK